MLAIHSAEPWEAPLMETKTIVDEEVIEEFVRVNVKLDPAIIETAVNVALPDLPLTTTGEAAAPLAEAEFKRIPVPDAVPTKFPLVAVIAPAVTVSPVPMVAVVVTAKDDPAVSVVVEAIDPGAINVDGILKVVTPAVVEAVI